MKKGWKVKKLDEICELSAGGDVPRTDFSKVKTEMQQIPIYSNGEKDNGLYGYTSIAKVEKPSITVSARGTIGFTVKRLESFFPVVRLIVVTPKDLNKVDLSFLDYSLRKINFHSSGSSIPQLTVPMIREYSIPLPPLPEQQRIVSILDHCFEAIDKAKANAEQNLQNAKELFESYLQGVFEKKSINWTEKKINQVSELQPKKKEAREKLKETDLVTFLPMKDLGILNKEVVGKEKRQFKDVVKGYTYFADNDILLAKITPCFENGKIGIAKNLINGIGFGSSEYMVFRSLGDILPEYLYYFLSRNQIRVEGESFMGGAVGHRRVSKEWIENYIIPFPKSLKEQEVIVQELDALHEQTQQLQSHYQKKIDNLEELKKSILQKAFAGELKTEKMVEETPLAPISESACPVKLKKHFIGVCCEAEKI